jgi:small subunit ribosomal protein S10e
MFIPKKDRLTVYAHVFAKGAIAVPADVSLKRHPQINVPNLYVKMLMRSLCSKKFATRVFAWQFGYITLTDAGVEYLRNYLHLAADIVPDTFKKPVKAQPEAPSFVQQRSEGAGGFGARRGRGGPAGARAPRGDFAPRGDGERRPFRGDGERPPRGDGERRPFRGDGERPPRGDGAPRGDRPPRAPRAAGAQ